MYGFRQRPLTWLFLIATACADLAGAATDYDAAWVGELIVGQTLVAGGWMAVGDSHRLARAGVFMAALLAFTAPDYFSSTEFETVWRFVLGTLVAVGLTTTIAAYAILIALRAFGLAPRPASRRWQISIVELLGWMIVVAIASLVLPEAVFGHLLAPSIDPTLSDLVSLAIAAAVAIATGLKGSASVAMAGGLLGAAGVVGLAARFYSDGTAGIATMLGAYAYVIAWILVRRMDDALVLHRSAANASRE